MKFFYMRLRLQYFLYFWEAVRVMVLSNPLCDDYYLKTFSGTKVLYYSEGLASEYVFEEAMIANFYYTETGKLQLMQTAGASFARI